MNFKMVLPCLAVLASSYGEARPRPFPVRDFGMKPKQTVIDDLKVKVLNRRDFRGEKRAAIKGRVLLGNNPCLAKGVKVHVKKIQKPRRTKIVAFKTNLNKLRRCTRELRPVYHHFKMKVEDAGKTFVRHYKRKGNHVALLKIASMGNRPGLVPPRPVLPPSVRPVRPLPIPTPIRPILPPISNPDHDDSFDHDDSLDLDDVRLGHPGLGGNGCPAGTTSTTLSPDKKVLSIIFDEYMAEAGEGTGKRIDRKSCNMAIPVHVPQGLSVSLFKLDYRGFVSTPPGGQARLSVNYFFAGSRGPRVVREFPGSFDDEYLFTDNLQAAAVVWSKCGQDVNLRINSSMMARSNNSMESALGTVDSVDVESGLKYHLKWRRCN